MQIIVLSSIVKVESSAKKAEQRVDFYLMENRIESIRTDCSRYAMFSMCLFDEI